MAKFLCWFLVLPGLVIGGWWLFEEYVAAVSMWWFVAFGYALLLLMSLLFLYSRPAGYHPKTSEREMLAMNRQFLSLYENSPVPYLTIDKAGKIARHNLAAIRLFQTESEALLGLVLQDMLSHEDDTALSVLLGKLQNELAIADAEAIITTKRGEERYVQISVFQDDVSPQRLVSMVDITHQKTVDRAKTEFVSLATHQLRTPVAAVKWNVELLMRNIPEPRSPKQIEYFTKIDRNIRRMIRLINDFLSVSKLETGTFATTPEPTPLKAFFTSVIDEYDSMITQKRLEIRPRFEPEEYSYSVDNRLLHITVSNLFSNALKYTPDEGVIEIGYVVDDHALTISVADSGIGVPEDEQAQLFNKFFRARNARSHQSEGTGLGLYIIQQAVEKMHGTITFISKENQGTRFTVTLPVR